VIDYLDHIRRSNDHEPHRFRPLRVDGRPVGKVRPEAAEALRAWPAVFDVGADGEVTLARGLQGFEARTRAVACVLPALVERGLLERIKGEPYAVTDSTPERALFLVDRGAAALFGVRTFGQHLNGYVRDGDRLHLWIARRALDRITYPGRLDNMVAGGLPFGISLGENLAKECREEAGIAPALAARARPVGAVGYNRDSPGGFKPDTLYCYDLELPPDFEPRCSDGEVESFHLWPVERVMDAVREGDAFKPNVNLVLIDFLIRHGYLGPEREDYLALVTGLRPRPFGC
jgi:8-oxo-dGTP pyrophosphatase MutT (NUDIX family)